MSTYKNVHTTHLSPHSKEAPIKNENKRVVGFDCCDVGHKRKGDDDHELANESFFLVQFSINFLFFLGKKKLSPSCRWPGVW